jgi:hypothetical protein
MSPGIDNNVDWTAPAIPRSKRVGPGLARAPSREATPPPKRDVMETLLGENSLAAFDAAGADPYNTTGRQFRR